MDLLPILLLGVFLHLAPAQAPVPNQSQSETEQTTPPGEHSALKVKPGGGVIKPEDPGTDTGYFHPFVRMSK